MGKGMKYRPKGKAITQGEFEKLWRDHERDLRERIKIEQEEFVEKQKADITGSATELAGCLYTVALHNLYGFGFERLNRIQEEIGRLEELMKEGTITWWDIRDEAARLGFIPANECGHLETERPEAEQ